MVNARTLVAFSVLAVAQANCGRTEHGDDVSASHGGGNAGVAAAAGSAAGAVPNGGSQTIVLAPSGAVGGTTAYPPSFGANECPAGPPPDNGSERCVTRAELTDDDRRLSVIGGFALLGTFENWRCPTIAELMADSGCSLGEGCCKQDVYCGPVARDAVDGQSDSSNTAAGGASTAAAGAGGVAGAAAGPADDHVCCYYMVQVCGV